MQTETKGEPRVRCFEPTAGFDRMTRIANVFMRPGAATTRARPAAFSRLGVAVMEDV
jgi:hypothetical protein